MKGSSGSSGYIKVSGGKVWYKIAGEGKKTPLVILHGGPGFPHDYLLSLEELAKERKVIFYDQLGCGNSDRPSDPKLWKIERFVEELATLIKELQLKKFHLYGHSWGTMLAVDYFLSRPEGIKSIMLASPIIKISLWAKAWADYKENLPSAVLETLKFYEEQNWYDAPEYLMAVNEFYKRHVCRLDPQPLHMNEAASKMGTESYLTMWGPNEFTCTGNLKDYDRIKEVQNLQLPVLITCGQYDGADPKSCRYYQKIIPRSKLKIFAKSAHMPHWEEKEEYLKALRKFISEVELKNEA